MKLSRLEKMKAPDMPKRARCISFNLMRAAPVMARWARVMRSKPIRI